MMSERSEVSAQADTAILLVGDEPERMERFVHLFGTEFPILTAAGGPKAELVLDAEREAVAILLCDLLMPEESRRRLFDFAEVEHPSIVRGLIDSPSGSDPLFLALGSGAIGPAVLEPRDKVSLQAEMQRAMALYRGRLWERDLRRAKRGAMKSLAAQVAHELSTPLVSIRMLSSSLEESMPTLIDAYRRDLASGAAGAIPEETLKFLETATEQVTSTAVRIGMMMQLLLVNTGAQAAGGDLYDDFSMRACATDALASYPFCEGERQLVELTGDDFSLRGSKQRMTYVFYNLLKNSIYAVRAARRGKVDIRIETDASGGRILVRDTGAGIEPDVLPRIFDDFFRAPGVRRGTGLGLPFCKRVTAELGGKIECRSRVGEFTEMELSFPRSGGRSGPGPGVLI